MANDIKFDVRISAQKAIANLNKLSRSAEKATSGLERYDRSQNSITKNSNRASRGIAELTRSSVKLSTVFAGALGAGLAIGALRQLGQVITGIGGKVVGAATDFETFKTQLEVLTGSAETAATLFNDLVEFSNKTPFEPEQVVKAGKTLLAFGLTADETRDRIKSLGDISAVSGKPLTDLARIFGQIQTQGKLTAERLNQLTDAGINLGPEISKSMGILEKDFRAAVTAGRVTAEETVKAFDKLTQEGGKFFGGTIKLAQTAGGVMSTLRGQVTFLSAEFGAKLLPILKFVGIELSKALSTVTEYVKENVTLGNVLDFVKSAIENVSGAVRLVSSIILGARVAINAWQQAWFTAISFILNGIEAVVGAVSKFGKFLKIDTTGIDNFKRSVSFLKQGATETAAEIEESNMKMIESFSNFDAQAESTTKRLIKGLDDFVAKDTMTSDAVVANDARTLASTQQATAEKLRALKQFQEQKATLEEGARIAEQEFQIAKDLADGEASTLRLENLVTRLGETEAIKAEARLREADNEREHKLILLEIEQTAAQQKLKLLREEQKNREEGNKAVQKIIDDDNKEFKVRDERNKRAVVGNTIQMFGALAEVSALGGKKLFKITKALGLAEAITAGIVSVQKAASALPYPANIPGIVAQTAFAAANVARISSQSAPSFEQGGIVPGNSFSGDNVVANVNSGEMILNRRQQQNLFEQINNGNESDRTTNVTVEIDGEQIAKAVSKQVANGLQLGEVI